MVLVGGHVWFYSGGHVWFYSGGVRGFIWGHAWFYSGACVVFQGGVHGFSGGHAWFFRGGMCGFSGGHVWFFQFFQIQRDTVNEQAVHILLECILVSLECKETGSLGATESEV